MRGMSADVEDGKLKVTHINVRPSISILVLQLISLNILSAAVVIGLYIGILSYQPLVDIFLQVYTGLAIIISVFLVQISLTIYAVVVWMNEYYEIFPEHLIHRRGIMFRKESKFPIRNVRFVQVNQGLLGKLLNYGTLTLLDGRRNKFLDMYLIHNPIRYYQILDKLNPSINEEKAALRETEQDEYEG